MNLDFRVEEAHRSISMAMLYSSGEVVNLPSGAVATWVARDTLMYLEALLNYGDWRLANLNAPRQEVKTLARRYGVAL